MEGIVPQTGLLAEWLPRRGKLLKVSSKPRKSIQTFNSYITKTWNELPKAIRNFNRYIYQLTPSKDHLINGVN